MPEDDELNAEAVFFGEGEEVIEARGGGEVVATEGIGGFEPEVPGTDPDADEVFAGGVHGTEVGLVVGGPADVLSDGGEEGTVVELEGAGVARGDADEAGGVVTGAGERLDGPLDTFARGDDGDGVLVEAGLGGSETHEPDGFGSLRGTGIERGEEAGDEEGEARGSADGGGDVEGVGVEEVGDDAREADTKLDLVVLRDLGSGGGDGLEAKRMRGVGGLGKRGSDGDDEQEEDERAESAAHDRHHLGNGREQLNAPPAIEERKSGANRQWKMRQGQPERPVEAQGEAGGIVPCSRASIGEGEGRIKPGGEEETDSGKRLEGGEEKKRG